MSGLKINGYLAGQLTEASKDCPKVEGLLERQYRARAIRAGNRVARAEEMSSDSFPSLTDAILAFHLPPEYKKKSSYTDLAKSNS